MSSEEGNLFANVLKQKRTINIKKPQEEEKAASASGSANKPGNMFAKLRTNNSSLKAKAPGEEGKEAGNDANLDSLFASAPVERKSNYG